MVKHGALSKSHVYQMLASKDARVRRAAFTLLEASNPTLRINSELFVEITRFIWDANPSYDVYQEFNKRHLIVRYKVHDLIAVRLKIEKQERQRAAEKRTDDCEAGFFKRLFRRHMPTLRGRNGKPWDQSATNRVGLGRFSGSERAAAAGFSSAPSPRAGGSDSP